MATEFSYTAFYEDITPGNGKAMAILFNTSSNKRVNVFRISAWSTHVAMVIGVILLHRILKITARSGGITQVIFPYNALVGLPTGVTADSGSIVTVDQVISRFVISSEEIVTTSPGSSVLTAKNQMDGIVWEVNQGLSPMSFGQSEGVLIRCDTNSVVGGLNYQIDFTTTSA